MILSLIGIENRYSGKATIRSRKRKLSELVGLKNNYLYSCP